MEAKTTANPKADASALHTGLVDHLKNQGHIQTPRVEAAFRAVPRHPFLPDVSLEQVYSDIAIPTKTLESGEAISSSSQPAIMAIMLEQLDLRPGQRVLEIGAGTGYNAALMAHIVGETGHVITLDLDEDIVAEARCHLDSAGFERVQVICEDGVRGYPAGAPYDRIILTVGSWDIAPAWTEQLKARGRFVLPLSIGRFGEKAVAFKQADGYLASLSIKPCGFMKLRGSLAAKSEIEVVQLGPEPGLLLEVAADYPVDPEAVYQWLLGPSKDWATTVQVSWKEIYKGLLPQKLQAMGSCTLRATGKMAQGEIVPPFIMKPGEWRIAGGVIGAAGLCLLMTPPDYPSVFDNPDEAPPFTLLIRSFGPDDALAQHLVDLIQKWDGAGRPHNKITQIKVYPKGVAYTAADNQAVISKEWTQLVIDFSA